MDSPANSKLTSNDPVQVCSRSIDDVLPAHATTDGAGVQLYRSVGSTAYREFDPFLMLDEIYTDQPDGYLAGFPDHPHRGFETVTYMLTGRMHHRDSEGNSGIIEAGGLQWMTAGSGIIHSEMPQQESGLLHGFQLWINLPAKHKMCPPKYQEMASAQVPEVQISGGLLRVLAGRFENIDGPIDNPITQPTLFDLNLVPHAELTVPLSPTHSCMIYLYRGTAQIGATSWQVRELALLNPDSNSDAVTITAGSAGCGALLIAAQPLNEPVHRAGPFVMSSPVDLEQAFTDYQQGRLVTRKQRL